MTLSAVAWQWEMAAKRAWPRKAIDWLFIRIERDHCRVSYEYEINRLEILKRSNYATHR